VVVLGGSDDPLAAAQQLIGVRPGPVVVGHTVSDLQSAPVAAAAVAGCARRGLAGRAAPVLPPTCSLSAP
jgi:hypothetical protein